jgi:hypothetical protein
MPFLRRYCGKEMRHDAVLVPAARHSQRNVEHRYVRSRSRRYVGLNAIVTTAGKKGPDRSGPFSV